MLPEFLRTPGHECLGVCPYSLIYKVPVVTEIIRAHRWCKGLNQSLGDLYPNGIPAIVASGIIEIEAGFNRAFQDNQDELERQRKQDERIRAAKNQSNNGSRR